MNRGAIVRSNVAALALVMAGGIGSSLPIASEMSVAGGTATTRDAGVLRDSRSTMVRETAAAGVTTIEGRLTIRFNRPAVCALPARTSSRGAAV